MSCIEIDDACWSKGCRFGLNLTTCLLIGRSDDDFEIVLVCVVKIRVMRQYFTWWHHNRLVVLYLVTIRELAQLHIRLSSVDIVHSLGHGLLIKPLVTTWAKPLRCTGLALFHAISRLVRLAWSLQQTCRSFCNLWISQCLNSFTNPSFLLPRLRTNPRLWIIIFSVYIIIDRAVLKGWLRLLQFTKTWASSV